MWCSHGNLMWLGEPYCWLLAKVVCATSWWTPIPVPPRSTMKPHASLSPLSLAMLGPAGKPAQQLCQPRKASLCIFVPSWYVYGIISLGIPTKFWVEGYVQGYEITQWGDLTSIYMFNKIPGDFITTTLEMRCSMPIIQSRRPRVGQ